jgi:hypothetical protein
MENLDRISNPYPAGCPREKPYFLLPKLPLPMEKESPSEEE